MAAIHLQGLVLNSDCNNNIHLQTDAKFEIPFLWKLMGYRDKDRCYFIETLNVPKMVNITPLYWWCDIHLVCLV